MNVIDFYQWGHEMQLVKLVLKKEFAFASTVGKPRPRNENVTIRVKHGDI